MSGPFLFTLQNLPLVLRLTAVKSLLGTNSKKGLL